jgi:hypothetical protein
MRSDPPNASGYEIHPRLLDPFSGGRSRELARFGVIDDASASLPARVGVLGRAVGPTRATLPLEREDSPISGRFL